MATARRRCFVTCASLGMIVFAAAASAQWGWGRLPEGRRVPPRFPPRNFADGAFTFCKVMYTEVRSEDMGVGWATDYPYAGNNLMVRLSELTKAPVSMNAKGEPNYWVVRLTDDALFRCPFTMASDVGTLGFSSKEAKQLREYLLKGGFLWVDDFWGTPAWQHWSAEIHKVLPDHRIFDVPQEHPIRHAMFDIRTLPQVTNIQFWGGTAATRRSGAPTAPTRTSAPSPTTGAESWCS